MAFVGEVVLGPVRGGDFLAECGIQKLGGGLYGELFGFECEIGLWVWFVGGIFDGRRMCYTRWGSRFVEPGNRSQG